MTTLDFATLGVAQPLLRALAGEGYDVPTPIQRQAIPLLLSGRDLLGMAQTGTGKTAAFVLPMLQRLSALPDRCEPKRPRALILVPTRELALQIGERIAAYGRHLSLRHTVVFGGVGQGPQVAALAKGIDILVATPGRLLDLVGQKHLALDRVSILVLDEADRMLDMGFVRDMRRIVALVPQKRQSLLFSATMPAEIARIAAEFLKAPERVSIRPEVVTVEIIGQEVIHVDAAHKPDMLNRLLADESLSRVIVFTRTKHGADKVTRRLLAEGFKARAIHGNKSQANRQAAIRQFRDGDIRVLVATDVAARGIDVADISHVVNFDIPNVPESYVHRIGRTGRAGNGGAAISLCDRAEVGYLRDIERLIRRPIARREGPGPVADGARRPAHRPAVAPRQPAEPAAGRRRQPSRRRRGSPVFAA